VIELKGMADGADVPFHEVYTWTINFIKKTANKSTYVRILCVIPAVPNGLGRYATEKFEHLE
jgi:hypothetical protein